MRHIANRQVVGFGLALAHGDPVGDNLFEDTELFGIGIANHVEAAEMLGRKVETAEDHDADVAPDLLTYVGKCAFEDEPFDNAPTDQRGSGAAPVVPQPHFCGAG